jgi:predicted ATPase
VEGGNESETGVQALGSLQPALVERLRANAEAARQHDQQQRSGSTAVSRSPVGDPKIRRALSIAGVPDLYAGADWGRVRSPAVQEWASQIVTRAARRSEEAPLQYRGHGLLMVGPVGTGKSSAAALCCVEGAVRERTMRYSYVPDLCDALMQTPRERAVVIRAQETVDLLTWDDFGVRDLADWEIGYLDQIVEARYRSRKPMIVTSNLTIGDLREDERLARMVDRWRERVCSQMVVLAGESMRTGVGR